MYKKEYRNTLAHTLAHTHTLYKMYQNHKISFIKFKCNKNMKAF